MSRRLGTRGGFGPIGELLFQQLEGSSDLSVCRQIRDEVFVREQGVAREVEQDGLDLDCRHWLALVSGTPVATARVRSTFAGPKLERVAVLRPWRGQSVGRSLVCAILESLPDPSGCYISAQLSAERFWSLLGFCREGAEFVVAGIQHVPMRYGDSGHGSTSQCVLNRTNPIRESSWEKD